MSVLVAHALDFYPVISTNGLPNKEVRRMMIDDDGYLWVATTNGLCCYDGYSYKAFQKSLENPYLLANNNVTCMAEDKQRHILLGSDQGLNILDRNTGKILTSKSPDLKNKNILFVTVTRKGKIYVSTPKHLYLYDIQKDKAQQIDTQNRPMINAKVYEDAKSFLWIGADDMLYRYDSRNGKYYEYPEFKKENAAHVIYEDSYHHIWIGSFSKGLTILRNPYDVKNPQMKRFSKNEGLLDNCVYAIVEDKTNHQLFVGMKDGLSVISLHESNRIVNYKPGGKNALPFNEVDALVNDENGTIWMGTLGGGIYYIPRKNTFVTNAMPEVVERLSSNSVKSMAWIGGKLWMGIGSYGLVTMDVKTGKYSFFQEMPGFSQFNSMSTLMSICPMSDGRVVMGSFFNGVFVYDRQGRVQRFDPYNSPWLPTERIFSLAEDHKKNCWIGTFKGLCIMDKQGKGYRLNHLMVGKKNLAGSKFQALLADREGRIWAGTKDHGLLCITPHSTQVELYSLENKKLNSDDVQVVFQDSNGRIWVGTNGGGICFLENDKFQSLNSMLGLPFDVVYSILEDDKGKIWAGTNSGLLCLYPKRQLKNTSFRLFAIANSLQDEIFLRGCAFKSPNGDLYFGGHRGYIHFNPNNLVFSQKETNAVITSFLIAGKPLYLPITEKEVHLNYNQNMISIEFSSMNLETPLQSRFLYKMEGVDDAWQMTNNYEHYVRYGNMKPGHYTFLLRAMNENGAWSKNVRKLSIYIAPPIWRTWYAYLLYIIIGILLVAYVIYQVKTRMQERIQLKFFTQVSHNLLTPLTVIKANIDDLSAHVPDYSNIFEVMRRNVEKQMYLILQILEANKEQTTSDVFREGTYKSPVISKFRSSSKKNHARVMIVEDNPDLLNVMVRLLENDYQVVTATNGAEALKTLEQEENNIDVIVSDIMMPIMDGIAFTQKVKANIKTCHIPVILLTARCQESDRAEGYNAGADAYLTKPFSLSVLLSRIKNLLRKKDLIGMDFKNQLAFEIKDLQCSDADEEFMTRAVACVENHLDDDEYDVNQMADEMNVGRTTLFNKLKSLTGMNISAFIRNVRLKAACKMIEKNPKMRISDIAYEVGFSSSKYFSRCFKAEFGMTPKEYQERFTS